MDPPQSSPRDQPPTLFLNNQEYIDDESVDHDIYRGDNRRDSRPTLQTSESGSAAVAASQGSSSSVSSGSFRLAGGRLGVLATRLERAITRWARNNWADSSSSVTSSTSSESSRSSFRTANKSSRRKRRPLSLADILQREQSERAVAARIRAREIGRAVPREFNLYVPPPSPSQDAWPPINQEQRVVRTFSLDVMLPQLDPLLRRPGKHRRPQQRSRSTRTEPDQSGHPRHRHPHRDHSARDEACNSSRTNALDGPSLVAGKGKDKIRSTTPSPNRLPTPSMFAKDLVVEKAPQAWWLDIASPSWEDMKTLGKLLHLHPLTLEDILQQEPREKLELFPKLGYYFIVFRAVEPSTPPERLDIVSQRTGSSQLPIQGAAKEICIYLVVLRDGICTFHFSNISEHLDRVRGKLQTAAQTARRSSAWIAHGILDSVVDSFFPVVEEIEEHVTAVESVVYSEDSPASTITPIPLAPARPLRAISTGEKLALSASFVDEKHVSARDVASVKTTKTQFSPPRLTCGLVLWRLRRGISRFINFSTKSKPRTVEPSNSRASFDLRRMARTRQLITSVARVLASKPEVIAAIRKRLLASDGSAAGDDAEVAVYFGDVQDHILTLQQSLVHYERMLSESHPMYLQNLRVRLLRARATGDYTAFIVAALTMAVIPPSVIIGACSMNVGVPHNDNGELWVFTAVLMLSLCVQILFLSLVRYWWMKAKRKHGVML